MALVTHRRAISDTTPGRVHGALWILRTARLRTLVLALAFATALHAPLFPTRLGALLRLVFSQPPEMVDEDEEVILPIELDDMFGDPPSDKEEPPEEEDDTPTAELEGFDLDGGVDDIAAEDFFEDDDEWDEEDGDAGAGAVDGGAALDAGPAVVADAGVDEADAGAPPGKPDGGLPPPKLADPYKVAGGAATFQPKHPNVRVYIAADRVRHHELGMRFSTLLLTIPEWANVLGGTKLNPMRDFDHILISGPQLRRSKHVVALMDFNTSVATIRTAISHSMAASTPRGAWVQQRPIPVASVGPNLQHRVAIIRKKKLLVMLPATSPELIAQLGAVKGFNRSTNKDIVVYLITPWRAFGHEGVAIPKRIKWLRVTFTAIPGGGKPDGGGYTLEAEAEDESPMAALEDARALERAIEAIRVWDLWIKKVEVIGRPTYTVKGSRIHGQAHVSLKQLRRIVAWMQKGAEERQKLLAKKRAKKSLKTKFKLPRPTATASK